MELSSSVATLVHDFSMPQSTLILVRHGQSDWNLNNNFAGWSDRPPFLTKRGEDDTHRCAEVLKEYTFDIAFTSRLQRSSRTLEILLEDLGQTGVETIFDSALNERHYGDLQGKNRAETAAEFGEEQVKMWRRDYYTRPPNGESIEDTVKRVTPFFKQYVMPHVHAGKTILMAIHGNSMRPIFQYFEGGDPQEIAHTEVLLCTPYIYTLNGEKLLNKEIRDVAGIVTKGGSLTEKKVEG